ncbi:vesicle-associated membrane protein-associated protein A [Oenanthe melanoleuca]|uniref:vesicle-associated membrane protein-associated protein A n=1 Tax=Oenanthe melanoleuca TaxID=2939378 RepID=UPI0024C1F7E8|nr:vesicle-associated membrane protein-associated protein A [Oenanthe melanoleuca]
MSLCVGQPRKARVHAHKEGRGSAPPLSCPRRGRCCRGGEGAGPRSGARSSSGSARPRPAPRRQRPQSRAETPPARREGAAPPPAPSAPPPSPPPSPPPPPPFPLPLLPPERASEMAAAGALAKHEQILVLDPPTDLKFKGPFTDVVTTNLKLRNPSDRKVCFKVKTTAPRRYCVRPNSGIIDPGSSVIVSVMLQPFDYDPNEKSKHKFMVQTTYAPPNITDMEAVWKEAKPDELMDSKLRCVFEMPNENDKLNDIDASKSAPVLNTSKQDGPMPKPHSVSLNDTETRKLVEECKRLQAEIMKLTDENRHLRDEGLRLRKVAHSDKSGSPAALALRDNGSNSLPSLLVVIAAIFIGFFLGKFIL